MTGQILVVDIEGAHAEFAVGGVGEGFSLLGRVACPDQDALVSHLQAALGEHLAKVKAAAFAAPGPVIGAILQTTHAGLRLDRDVLSHALGVERVELLNDFAARAMAMPLLLADQLESIGGAPPRGQDPALALGPSAEGLGVSVLNPDGFVGWVASAGEGGHAELAAGDRREAEVIDQLRHTNPYVSADRVLSQAGLIEVCAALHALEGLTGEPTAIDDLVLAARAGEGLAQETFALFSGWLGAVAGNFVLMAGARSGAYIFSPVMLSWIDLFDREACRSRFEAKGRLSHFMTDIPMFLVTEPRCGLLGLSAKIAAR